MLSNLLSKVNNLFSGHKKGSYFFVIDAFIAGLILVSSIAIILSFFSINQPTVQLGSYLSDYSNFLLTTPLSHFQNDVVQKLVDDGFIDDTSLSLLDQIVYFYYQNLTDNCTGDYYFSESCISADSILVGNTTYSIPSDIGFRLSVYNGSLSSGGSIIYERSPKPYDRADNLVSTTMIDHLFLNSKRMFGPVIVKVELWS